MQDYLLNQDSAFFASGLLKNFNLSAVLEFGIEIKRMKSVVDYQKEGLVVLSYSCSLLLKHSVYSQLCFFSLEFA